MNANLRSAMISTAAFAICAVAPAQAGCSDEMTPGPVASLDIPKVATPDLLALDVEPLLSGDETPALEPAPVVEEAPAVTPGGDLSEMVAQLRASEPGDREMECLATGIYFESKSEPLHGQLAVGKVIANRANSKGRFPSTYCGVLFQRGQFSFVRGKSLPPVPRSSKQWKTAVAIAKIVHDGLKESSVGNALFFHARRVSPGWRLKRVATMGNHIFYR